MRKKFVVPCIGLLAISCLNITARANDQIASELKTKTGNEIGLTVSSYDYREPALNISLKATKLGIDYSGAHALSDGWYARGDLRYADGKVDYSGSGTMSNRPEWHYELRGMIGKDFDRGAYNLSPYFGLGYRYLFSDIRGVTSTGDLGYRRKSQYAYLPVGVTYRFKLESNARLSTTLEYNHLIKGQQKSYVTDVTNLVGDQTNDQHKGYGIKGSMYYEKNNWLFGPWFHYWNINQSDSTSATLTLLGVPYAATFWEPKNKTTEIGLKLGIRF